MHIQKCSLINFTTIFISVNDIYEIDCKKFIVRNGEITIHIDDYKIDRNNVILTLKSSVNIKRITNIFYDDFSINVDYISLYTSAEFNDKFFTDSLLGAEYTKQHTTFRLWSPVASYVNVLIYENGDPSTNDTPKKFKMIEQSKGVWFAEIKGNLKRYFYTYELKVFNSIYETIDPYAKACGVNGLRGAIVDLKDTNPTNFSKDAGPEIKNLTDAIIYEMSIRDISIHPDSGAKYKGKYLALSEEDTQSSKEVSTILSHLVELGVTHVQLMPVFDFSYKSIDERNSYKYNWGYDPQNYNIPEGSYSTDPFNPLYRIYELKKAIFHLHKHDIGVVMDVVYNHVFQYENSPFEKTFPGYYFRRYEDGTICSGSGCGNDIATERPMVRKYIIDSLLYWAQEYHIDGFRFDLMGLHDVETMNIIRETLNSTGKRYLLYGEGWSLNTNLPDNNKCTIYNNRKLKGFGFFNDVIRDLTKGTVFGIGERGFVSGKPGVEYMLKHCITGSTLYPDNNKGVFENPEQSINYTSCHDNYTLWDKLKLSCPEASEEEMKAMNKLADGIVLTCLGVAFINSGAEFCRTKDGVENSYNSADTINRLDWHRKKKYLDVFEYYKGLIKLRKEHSAFRMANGESLANHFKFLDSPAQTVSFMLKDHANYDIWKNIIVIYNASRSWVNISIPDDHWHVIVDGEKSGTDTLDSFKSTNVSVGPISLKVIYAN